MKSQRPSAKSKFLQGYFNGAEKYVGPRPIIYRSSYELKSFIWCERNTKVLEWTSEPFGIPYFFEGKQRNYYIDLIAKIETQDSEGNTVPQVWYIEVKPEKEVVNPSEQNKSKWNAAREYAIQNGGIFKILTERVLSQIPIKKAF